LRFHVRGDDRDAEQGVTPRTLPSHSREKMRCADFRVFSMRVQGPQAVATAAQH